MDEQQEPSTMLTTATQQFENHPPDNSFTVTGLLGDAWQLMDGQKWRLNIILSVYFLAYLGIVISITLLCLLLPGKLTDPSSPASLIGNIAGVLLPLPLMAGLGMTSIKASLRQPISNGELFVYFHKLLPLALTMILMYLMIFLGFVLLILPGIYLAISYSYAQLLVVEKNLSPWQAMEISRRAITQRWFSVLGFFILIGIINALTVFTLFIATIWTIPMSMIASGLLYRKLFGLESQLPA